MKLTFTFILIFIFSIYAFDDLALLQQIPGQCRTTKFGSIGDDCQPQRNSTLQCKQFLACVNGKCAPGHIGAFCQSSSDCWLSSPSEEGIRCINSRCTKKRYNGYKCSLNDECYSTTCTNGICTGYPAGETCDPEQPVQCNKGLYCSYKGRICVAQKRQGELCDDYDPLNVRDIPEGSNYMIICPGGTRCLPVRNQTICREVYTKKQGETCSDSEDCYPSLVCRNGQCVDRFVGGIQDTLCTGAGRNCSSAMNERCVCINGELPSCKQTANTGCSFTNTVVQWTDCWRRSNCHWERNMFTAMFTEMLEKDTCMGQFCSDIPKQSICCRNNGYNNVAYSQGFIGPVQCTNTSTITGIVVVLILIFITGVCIGLTILGIWLYQKRKQESFERLPD